MNSMPNFSKLGRSRAIKIRLPWVLVTIAFIISACSGDTHETFADEEFFTCIAPPKSTKPVAVHTQMAVIGDSYTGGTPEGGTGERRWTSLVNSELKRRGIEVSMKIAAEGGAGYVARGRRTGDVFANKIAEVVRPGQKLVVVFGSINDAKASASELARATCNTLRDAATAAPGGKLLVIGPPWVDGHPPNHVLQSRDILRVRARELDATFIDPIAEKWFVDQPELIGSDGIHPTDAGHAYMAERIGPVVERLLADTPGS